MSAVCPNGHTSESEDYCDTCGSPIDAAAVIPAGGSGNAAGSSSGTAAGSGPGGSGSAAGSGASTPAGSPGAGGPGTAAGSGPGASGSGAAAGSAPGASSSGSAVGASPRTSGSGGPGSGGSGSAAGSGASTPAGSPGGGPGASSLDLGPAATPGSAAVPAGTSTPAAPAGLTCPNCQFENVDGALFCEACGYDFTTGAMPRGASTAAAGPGGSGSSTGSAEPAAFAWVAEVWVDPDWYATQEAEDPCPSPGLPTIIPLRERSVLLGRVSSSRNTRPEIDLSSDPGVSRRHAQLTTDGTRWFVEDLGSSNGTFVGPAAGPLPDKAIATGPKTEMDADDRLYVGAWTRVVVREATPEETQTYD